METILEEILNDENYISSRKIKLSRTNDSKEEYNFQFLDLMDISALIKPKIK
jgi:hypothetical protein